MTLGNVNGVRRILGASSLELAQSEVEAYLEEADRKIRARHFSKYMNDMFYANSVSKTGVVNRTYETYFPIKEDSDVQVFVSGQLAQDPSDYSIVNGVITFVDSFDIGRGEQIIIRYIPEFFDDYANYMAGLRMYMTSVIDANTAVAQTNIANIKETLKEYERMIASKPHMVRARDHMEVPNDIY